MLDGDTMVLDEGAEGVVPVGVGFEVSVGNMRESVDDEDEKIFPVESEELVSPLPAMVVGMVVSAVVIKVVIEDVKVSGLEAIGKLLVVGVVMMWGKVVGSVEVVAELGTERVEVVIVVVDNVDRDGVVTTSLMVNTVVVEVVVVVAVIVVVVEVVDE